MWSTLAIIASVVVPPTTFHLLSWPFSLSLLLVTTTSLVIALTLAWYLTPPLPSSPSWSPSELRHASPLIELAEGLWMVEGTNAYPLPRNMFVFALPSGGLLVYSVVALDEDGMRALDLLGPVQIMVVPSPQHTHDAARYQARYPRMVTLCASQAVQALIARGIAVTDTFDSSLLLEAAGISVLHVPGLSSWMASERVLVVPFAGGRSKALLFCDLVFNLLPHQCSSITRLLGSGPFFGPTRILRWFGVSDRASLRAFFIEMSYMKNISALLMTHGTPYLRLNRIDSDIYPTPGEVMMEAAARI